MKVLLSVIALTLMALGLFLATRGEAQTSNPSIDTFQGKSAKWWAQRTTYWKKNALKRGRTIKTHKRALRKRVRMGGSGVTRGFLCIHSFEGSWQDPNAPYWGGLQMDMSFQRAYGKEFLKALGTADNWPPFIQIAVAMKAYYSGRGFQPWPNTRRMCGL